MRGLRPRLLVAVYRGRGEEAGEGELMSGVDLVLEGGGVKGVALVGAFFVIEERGYEPEIVAGASAGAIVAALIATG